MSKEISSAITVVNRLSFLISTVCLKSIHFWLPFEVHDNVGHLWSELVRLLRDMQYTAECKRNDCLLESLQSERNVRHLMSRMLPDNVEQRRDSIIVNAAAILITLLETNFIPNWFVSFSLDTVIC